MDVLKFNKLNTSFAGNEYDETLMCNIRSEDLNCDRFFTPPPEAIDAFSSALDSSPRESSLCFLQNETFEEDSNEHNSSVDHFKFSFEEIIQKPGNEPSISGHSKTDDQITHENTQEKANYSNTKVQNQDISQALDEICASITINEAPKFALRKDVMNKTILRIMSRYFRSIAEKSYPDFKRRIKNQDLLEELLQELCYKLFPSHACGNFNLKYVLGALICAPQTKALPLDPETLSLVTQVHKCLSKYTHKDLRRLHKSGCIKLFFNNFVSEGLEFFNDEDIVKRNPLQYAQALEEFKISFRLHNCKTTDCFYSD